MTNLSLVSPDGVSENQVIRSNVAKTQQPDAEGLNVFKCATRKHILYIISCSKIRRITF